MQHNLAVEKNNWYHVYAPKHLPMYGALGKKNSKENNDFVFTTLE
jgi:hypothetical protein